ncbi:hypothetical protein J2Q11_12995 [Tenacibaculum finnmarkense genomovar finnmarkense]|uniref:hypothetical protein n=1 Tax=Tenacibaculum finnmarkense TaxID=2781243 RepID=UPI001E5CB6B7|nr:hypothetical protein [Tenacibaculum finnmarkense]MCD8418573.1 hypothetical protein [Tenacibaculum finnmarkense genomovar finnmarkense]MCG8186931.1 hypothetical protein [Tenacibaculum finnmarkense genomovar finnmarkense]MCG8203469.1 hypothetical protein [Tenacibaculum finnmarkense genomovar finnmarkense]MCG8210953.1 hypothetical protein [Tenacibaculum finnmarkense genomovar finnmarkense]MCG8213739.1 hypothetical protein [Tenacibaculum finnmarkense genomovar finnmarkense]
MMYKTLSFQGEVYLARKGETLQDLVDRFCMKDIDDLCIYHNLYCPIGLFIHRDNNLRLDQKLYLPKYVEDNDRIKNAILEKEKSFPAYGESLVGQKIRFPLFKNELTYMFKQQVLLQVGKHIQNNTITKKLKLTYVSKEEEGHIISIDIAPSSKPTNKMMEAAAFLESALFPIFFKIDVFGHYSGMLFYKKWHEEWTKRSSLIIEKYNQSFCNRLLERVNEKTRTQPLLETYLRTNSVLQNLFFPIYRDSSIEKETNYWWYIPNIGSIKSKGIVSIITEKGKVQKGKIIYNTSLEISKTYTKQVAYYLDTLNKVLKNEQGEGHIVVEALVENNNKPFSYKSTKLEIRFGDEFIYTEKTSLKL